GPGGGLAGEDLGDAGCYTYVNAEFKGSDCTQPHELEVFDTIGLDADFDTYPDHDQLVQTVTDKCAQKYADLGATAQKPLVVPSVAVPTKEAWDADKHRGLCVVRGQNNALESGSVSDN
ncbi:septum formation family protein, partial [Kibdelosporangium lantanae]